MHTHPGSEPAYGSGSYYVYLLLRTLQGSNSQHVTLKAKRLATEQTVLNSSVPLDNYCTAGLLKSMSAVMRQMHPSVICTYRLNPPPNVDRSGR